MLVMDCNLYESHITALNYLFKNKMISEGAIILFSDWNVNRASPDYSSRKAWGKIILEYSVNYSDNGIYCWGGKKFIVHSYS